MDRLRALNDDDEAFDRWFGPWTPLIPAGVADLLAGVAAPWWVVRGWAIEAFTGWPRDHHDIDVGFFRGDLRAILEQLAPTVCVWSNASGTLARCCTLTTFCPTAASSGSVATGRVRGCSTSP